MSHTAIRVSHDPTQAKWAAKLRGQYHRRILQPANAPVASNMGAAALIPSMGAMHFGRPITPVGSVVICVLSHVPVSIDTVSTTSIPVFRGYVAEFNHATGTTQWGGGQRLRFTHAIGCEAHASKLDAKLLRKPSLLDVALGLHHAIVRKSGDHKRIWPAPVLPATLLGFDADAHVPVTSTSMVISHAKLHGLTIDDAWHALYTSMQVKEAERWTGLQLIDARLCVHARTGVRHLPPILRTYHDLRGLLGRRLSNPVRKLKDLRFQNPAGHVLRELHAPNCDPGELSQSDAALAMGRMRHSLGPLNVYLSDDGISRALVNPAAMVVEDELDLASIIKAHSTKQLTEGLRQFLPPSVAAGCTDEDFMTALNHPTEPLVASQLARFQVWQTDAGNHRWIDTRNHVEADLQTLPADWERRLRQKCPRPIPNAA